MWHFRLFRLIWIQVFKRSPINIRPLLLVKKDYNPKALALFLTSYCNLYRITAKEEYLNKIHFLANKLIHLKSAYYSGASWGYNFPWQSREGFSPSWTPTIVVTSFASYALMDAYECTRYSKYLETALSSCHFVIKDLIRTQKGDGYIFSYSPLKPSCVYNASLLGSRMLARAYNYCKDDSLLESARGSILACANAQRDDGAWAYGELPFQNWVDSFHTGFNLECIGEYQKYSGDKTFSFNLERGFSYYLNNFFLDDGTPKYYDKKVYPIDIHSPAQFIVTLYRLNKINEYNDITDKVLYWTINNMQNKHKGYFFYQLRKRTSCNIPYMRWGQAWMFYALSFYFLHKFETENSIKF